MKFTVIGISDNRDQSFTPEVLDIIHQGTVFSGGKRHHELMLHLLPQDCQWIDITVPISGVIDQYTASNSSHIVVFASGDPLFFGFANTLRRLLPDADIQVYPYFNSLQLLAHRMLLAYHDMRTISLTGRPWDALDKALIQGEKLIGSLTDQKKTPALIAARMLEYGYGNYTMTVGECLGNRNEEQVHTLSLQEATAQEFRFPNCIILQQTTERPHRLGIPESEFNLLNGRVNMITKMPIRLLTLSMLNLQHCHTFWDVGSCTGSISIEAKLQFPHLAITAFEIRPEGEELLLRNCRKFGTPGIQFLGGDFLTSVYHESLSDQHPDAVFIGGHGGHLKEMILALKQRLAPEGCIVFNSVSENSLNLFREGVAEAGMRIVQQTRIVVDEHNPIEILKAQ